MRAIAETISFTRARQNLGAAMDLAAAEPVIITRQKAEPVVMMSLEEFNSLHETLYLLGSPANAAALRKGLEDIEAGRTVTVSLDELDSL